MYKTPNEKQRIKLALWKDTIKAAKKNDSVSVACWEIIRKVAHPTSLSF